MNTRLKDIRLLLLDVDGVMTDGGIIYDGNGLESKVFNVKDGHGIKMLQRGGIEVGIITGRTSVVVEYRARELGIELVYQGALKKLESYEDVKRKRGFSDSQIAYMGDDIIDVPVMRRCRLSNPCQNWRRLQSRHVLFRAALCFCFYQGIRLCRQ